MALVPLPDKSEIDPADLAAIELGEKNFGRMLYTWQAIANKPGMFALYFPFLRSVTGPGALDQRIKEMTALQVAILNHCRYTVSHRCYSALAKGVTHEELAKIAANDFASFTENERLAFEFTQAVTRDLPATTVSESYAGISDDLGRRVQAAFAPDELIELLMSIGIWNLLSRFHRVLNFELDLPEPPESVDAAL